MHRSLASWLTIYFILMTLWILNPSPLRAATLPKSFDCWESFAQVKETSLALDFTIDKLLGVESELSIAEATTNKLLRDGQRNSSLAAERLQRQAELVKLRERYETLSNEVLDGPFNKVYLENAEALERDLRQVTSGANQPSHLASSDYSAMIDHPSSVRAEVRYDVPQPADLTGHSAVQSLSVTFSTDVLKYFDKDPTRASHFLRALQKGYIAPYGGSGIRRLTEHGNLVEVKIKGDVRLLGCRGKNGHIEILKAYVKHNHGEADMKRFAHLCD